MRNGAAFAVESAVVLTVWVLSLSFIYRPPRGKTEESIRRRIANARGASILIGMLCGALIGIAYRIQTTGLNDILLMSCLGCLIDLLLDPRLRGRISGTGTPLASAESSQTPTPPPRWRFPLLVFIGMNAAIALTCMLEYKHGQPGSHVIIAAVLGFIFACTMTWWVTKKQTRA